MKKGVLAVSMVVGALLIGFVTLCSRKPPIRDFDSLAGFETTVISPIIYDHYQKDSRYLEMPDGTQLAMDIFIPNGKKGATYPTIFEYTPYNRSAYLPGLKWYERVVAKWKTGSWGPIFDKSTDFVRRNLIARGYAYVVVDMRGTGASSGKFVPLSTLLGKDGAVVVDWIEGQIWSNGKVGMVGQSFHGWSQWATASNQPKALKCIAPALIMFDTYSESTRPGGILAESWLTTYSDLVQALNHNVLDTSSFDLPALPSAPVVDEDNDGNLSDEVPLMKGKPVARIIDQVEPTYRDGGPRTHHYYFRFTKEHLAAMRPDFIVEEEYRYFDDSIPGERPGLYYRYHESSPGYMIPKVIEADIAVLNIGAWFDAFAKGGTQLHASMAQNGGNSRLFMGPRFHKPSDELIAPYITYLNYAGDLYEQEFLHTLRFFDYYLKEVENGWNDEDPVLIYTAHKGWQTAQSWPPPTAREQVLYLGKHDQLLTQSPDSGSVAYEVDFSHASNYGEKKHNKWVMVRPSEYLMDRTESDKQTVFFETSVLEEDLEITGHPIAELFIGSNRPDADVFIYLCDVDENGRSIYVSEGQLRASWHRDYDPGLQVNKTYKVAPQLPWHGFERDMEHPSPTADGAIVGMKFDLFPVSWVFRKGHRIRIAIAGVDAGNFEINPSWVSDAGTLKAGTRLFISHGGRHASRIILPSTR